MSAELPRLEDLELFVAVTDTGSVGAAARLLGYTQPTASRMIARCEHQLGIPLLVRTHQGSDLTAEGELVAEWARRIVTLSANLLGAIDALGSPSTMHVVASQTIAEACLPVWLSWIRSAHPELDVSAEVDNSHGVIRRVRDGSADLGFLENFDEISLAHRTVDVDRMVLRVPVGHPWASRRSVTVAELAAEPLIVREEGSGTRDAIAQLAAGLPTAAPLETLHSNAAVRLAVVNGNGPAVLSELAWQGLDARGLARTAAVRIDAPDVTRELRAVWEPDRPTAALAAEIAGLVADANRLPG